jgi:hypothetical protein
MILNLCEKNPELLLNTVRSAFHGAPTDVTFELLGPGNMIHDTALMLFDELINRPPGTHLRMHARTSLFDGAILIWLCGDTRTIRRDAWIQLSHIPETPPMGQQPPFGEQDYTTSIIVEDEPASDTDLRTIMDYLEEWLPVTEIAGQRLLAQDLRELGLLDGVDDTQTLARLFTQAANNALG